jgi:hypothetical protein
LLLAYTIPQKERGGKQSPDAIASGCFWPLLADNGGLPCLSYLVRYSIFEQEGMCMYAAYHLNVDELNADLLKNLKQVYRQREIVILPKDTYEEWEKERHNAAFTAELQRRIKALDEGKGIVKTMAELRAMENV